MIIFQPHFRVRLFLYKALANSTKLCYTYDELDRVVKRTFKELNGTYISEENYSYDAASNLTSARNTNFVYDTNNRLTAYGNKTVSYDADGNMLSDGDMTYEYDSANRLIKASDNEYTYNAEDVRIRNLCGEYDTAYTYDTNVKLSRLLVKATNGITTKYVYGKGLIGQEKEYCFRTYHFDYRGSTVAITDVYGNVTDRFEYDTYGKMISHIGDSFVIFGYNGRDGVITDKNGLLYMRARYYSPDMRRFINADIIAGQISNSATLNRYAYANGNPTMNVDPLGLSAASWLMQEKKHQRTERKVTPSATTTTAATTPAYDPSYAKMTLDEQQTQEQWENTQKTAARTSTSLGAEDFLSNTIDTIVDAVGTVIKWVDNNIISPVVTVANNISEDFSNYDKNNTDEQKVLASHYFSSYNGKFVVRTNMNRSVSFGILFITHETNNRTNPEDVIRHEYGHTKQLDQLGFLDYALFIALPSWQEWGREKYADYYDRPWEVTADVYGEVQSRTPSQDTINAGETYLNIVKSDVPIWEKIALLKPFYQ